MKNNSCISSVGQLALGEVLAAAFKSLENQQDRSPEAAEQAITVALGGDGCAQAVVASWTAALAYQRTKLPTGFSALQEGDLARQAANAMVLPIEQARLQACISQIETATLGGMPCSVAGCRGRAVSQGRRPRTFLGCHGPVTLKLRRVTCEVPECGAMHLVALKPLGLGHDRFLPRCAEAITQMSTTLPYGQAVQTLADLLGIDVSEHAAQDLTENRAATLLALDQVAASDTNPEDSSGLARSVQRPADSLGPQYAPNIAYLETDGVFPMTRERLVEQSVEVPGARGGKGRKFKLEGREVKNAVLYTSDAVAQEMPSRGCLIRRHYVSHLGHWRSFALLVWLAMLRLRFDQAKLLVILSDGADWIRSFAKWLPMGNRVLCILDLFHAVHRIWDVARAIYGDRTDACQQRAQMWKEVIEAGHVDYVIRELKEMRDGREAVQEKIDALITYFENNQDRMNYPAYVARGLRITSGIVESANFHVTGARLKQQGMRWSEPGARELAMLRADLCSGRWRTRTNDMLQARLAA